MNELIKEAYIQSQCQVLGCSKTQYLHDIAMAQTNLTRIGVIICGVVLILGILILVLSFFLNKKHCPESTAFAFTVLGCILVVFGGVLFTMNLTNYMMFIDNPNVAILHWIDGHINICSN